MTPFLPPLDSMWALSSDWRMPAYFITRYDNSEFLSATDIKTSVSDWPCRPGYGTGTFHPWTDQDRADYKVWVEQQIELVDAVIPAGSIFSMERYHVSRSGEDQITLMMYRSPRLELSPRKRGGKGKGKMRFYVSLAEFNTFGLLKEFSE